MTLELAFEIAAVMYLCFFVGLIVGSAMKRGKHREDNDETQNKED